MKDIPGYEGLYAITLDQNVWSYPKKGKHKGIWLKQGKNKCGYLTVTLSKEGVWKPYGIHCLMAITYIPNPNNLPVVKHLDDIKINNDISNLSWDTQKNNIKEAHENGLCPYTDKQREALKKIQSNRRRKICQIKLDGSGEKVFDSITEAFLQTGIGIGNISNCCLGKRKTSGGSVWKFI